MATVAPLVVTVGPTASGKTSLAIDLAEQYGGEIICADSRTIYRHMDIGTAKPSAEEQARVPHHGLDLVEPGEHFTAADFKRYALQKIEEIRARGNIPFLVGGTGLYVDAVVYDYQFGPKADPALRAELESMTLDELHNYCAENNITLPENEQNKRYVVRAIEQKSISVKMRDTPITNSIVVGIATDRVVLRQRITDRAEHLFDNGVVQEATELAATYGWDSEAMTGNIYKLVKRYSDGEVTEDQLKELFIISDWQLAKRQLTWLKRRPATQWLELPEAQNYISRQLASYRES